MPELGTASDRVVLPATDLAVSRLGFGTSGLMARLDRQASLRLLCAAHEAGITHFDTARLYGYGEAEGVVGEFLRGRRNDLTVATKAGILPPSRSRHLSMAKAVARGAVTLWPPLRTFLRRRADAMVQPGAFDIPLLEASLHTSLRELRTDRVDILFLHECTLKDLKRPELVEFLERAQRAGKILHYGVAASPEVCAAAHLSNDFARAVLQFPNGAATSQIARVLPPNATVAVITHSALGLPFQRIYKRLQSDDALTVNWSEILGIDVRDRHALAAAFLAYACNANPLGCVLFSSTNEENMRRNMLVARRSEQYQSTCEKLDACLAMIMD